MAARGWAMQALRLEKVVRFLLLPRLSVELPAIDGQPTTMTVYCYQLVAVLFSVERAEQVVGALLGEM